MITFYIIYQVVVNVTSERKILVLVVRLSYHFLLIYFN